MEKAGTQPGAGSRLEEDSLPDAGAEGVADRRRRWATCLRLQGPLATQRGAVGPRGRGCLHGRTWPRALAVEGSQSRWSGRVAVGGVHWLQRAPTAGA